MKKLFLFPIAMLCALSVAAQQSTDSTKVRKNSVAVNVNGLLAQVFTNNNNSQMLLVYRRHFKSCNLRFGLGGYRSESRLEEGDTTIIAYTTSWVNVRPGIEFPVIRYNKWHAYLGVDAMLRIYENNIENDYDNGVHRLSETDTKSIGGSALCGINYQLNPFISFGAEATYDVGFERGLTTETYSTGGWVYSIVQTQYKSMYSSHSAPIHLNVRIHF